MRLKRKMTFGILLILLVSLLAAGKAMIGNRRTRLLENLEKQGDRMATLVAEFSVLPIRKYSFFILQEVALSVEQFPLVVFCEIYDENRASLVQVDARIRGRTRRKKERRLGEDILVIEKPILSENEVIGIVEIGLFLTPVREEIRKEAQWIGIAIFLVMGLVALSLRLFISHNFITPVIRLLRATQTLARGEFIETDVKDRRDEIGELARSFNTMSANLKNLYRDLENKVTERTAALAGSNRLLENEIRERKRAERELKRAKEAAETADRYKSIFVTNMSHEIRTPLNAILGYAQILQCRSTLDEDTRHAVNSIGKSGSHLLTLVNDILDMAKIESGALELREEPFDLAALIRNLSTMFELRCGDKNLGWEIRGLENRPGLHVRGDQGKLRQVLINLLSNAVKFTKKGSVVLGLDNPSGDRYLFYVEDTGPGIPEEMGGELFKPFRGKDLGERESGTGLGLTISKRYIEMMGGTLSFDTAGERGGTRFFFDLILPSSEAAREAFPGAGPGFRRLSAERRILALIADDVADNRAVLATLLSDAGVSVIEAGNGREAVEMCGTFDPDIVFMDRHMPGMDGMEAAGRIRKDGGGVAMVMVTADIFDGDSSGEMDSVIDSTITKPFESSEIFDAVERLLGVSFETDPVPPEPSAQPDLDPGALELPGELKKRIKEAAEFCKFSELQEICIELEELGEKEMIFAGMIRSRLKLYDMDAIDSLVKKTTGHAS